MRDHTEDNGNASRNRGSALVVVLLFGVVIMLLVATVLTLAGDDLKGQYENHHTKVLNLVLQSALEDATYEINRHRLGGGVYDPDGDGVGALGTGLGAAPDGVQVRDATGRLMGLYRTTVHEDPEGTVIYAVAVRPRDVNAPNFANPRAILASKLLVSPKSLIDPANIPPPLDFPNAKPDKVKIDIKKDSEMQILSGDPLDPTKPSVNFAHKGFFDDVITVLETGEKVKDLKIEDNGLTLGGMDRDNPGSTTDGTDSIGNNSTDVFTDEVVNGLADGIVEYVEQKADAAYDDPGRVDLRTYLVANVASTDLDKDDDDDIHVKNSAVIVLPEGVYEARKLKLEDNVTLTGSGTLIVSDKFEIKNNSQLNWTGDIIVVGDDEDDNKKGELKVRDAGSVTGSGNLMTAGKVKLGGDDAADDDDPTLNWTGNVLVVSGEHKDHYHKAEMKVEKEGGFYVDGVVALVGVEKEAKFEVKKEGNITVDGALMVLAGQSDDDDEDGGKKAKAKLKFDKGGDVTVNGVMMVMGTEVKLQVKKDETLTVNGAGVLAITEHEKSKLSIKVDKGSNVSFTGNDDNVRDASEDLENFIDDLNGALDDEVTQLGIDQDAYWEVPDAQSVFDTQSAAIAGGTVGFPE